MKKFILLFTLLLTIFFIGAPISAAAQLEVLEEEGVELIDIEIGDFILKLPSNWQVEFLDDEDLTENTDAMEFDEDEYDSEEFAELYIYRIDNDTDDYVGYLYATYTPGITDDTFSEEEIEFLLGEFLAGIEDSDVVVIEPEYTKLGENASVLCVGELTLDEEVFYFDMITILSSTGDLYSFMLQRETAEDKDPDYDLIYEQVELFDALEQSKNIENEDDFSKDITTGMSNAVRSAESYLTYSSFSKLSLVSQLEFEGFTNDEALYAVNNIDVDWKEQALESAKSYLEFMSFSYSGLIKQLEFEKFTSEEATYGVDNSGADWMEQAVKSANQYLETMSFSKSGLINQLKFEGFTDAQARYGVENADANW